MEFLGERRFGRACLGVALSASLSMGCGPSAVRTGPTVPLPTGAPRTACESKDWYELAPASLNATAATAGIGYNVYYQGQFNGLGVFRPGAKEPEKLEDVWPRLSEPRLQQLHEARIEAVDAAAYRSLYWALGGLAGLAAGVGGAVALSDSHPNLAAASGITGLALSVVGVVGALVAQPSGQEQLEAEARTKLFLFPEDDRAAVDRGVDRSNLAARASCAR